MTPDEIAKLIPANVVEAYMKPLSYPVGTPVKDVVRMHFAAGLAAWGGMVCDVWKEDPEFPGQIILPLQGPAP